MHPCCLRLCAARLLKDESNQDRKKREQTGKMIQGVLVFFSLALHHLLPRFFFLFFFYAMCYKWKQHLKDGAYCTHSEHLKFSSRKGCKLFYFLIQIIWNNFKDTIYSIKPLWKRLFSFFFFVYFFPLVLGLRLNIHFEKHGKASNVGKFIETCIWKKKEATFEN